MRGVVPLWAGGQAGWLSVSRAWKLVKKSEACLRGLAPVLLLCSHMQAPRAAGNRSRPSCCDTPLLPLPHVLVQF